MNSITHTTNNLNTNSQKSILNRKVGINIPKSMSSSILKHKKDPKKPESGDNKRSIFETLQMVLKNNDKRRSFGKNFRNRISHRSNLTGKHSFSRSSLLKIASKSTDKSANLTNGRLRKAFDDLTKPSDYKQRSLTNFAGKVGGKEN